MFDIKWKDGVPDENGLMAEIIEKPLGYVAFEDRTMWASEPTQHNAKNMNCLEQRYYCNGINDNEVLSQMSKDFFKSYVLPGNASMRIIVSSGDGFVGETENPLGNRPTTTDSDPDRFWDLGMEGYSGNRKLYLDFSNARFKRKSLGNGEVVSKIWHIARMRVNSKNVVVERCNLEFEINLNFSSGLGHFYGIHGGGKFVECTSWVESRHGRIYGFFGAGKYIDCTGTGEITAGNSFGFHGNGEYINCTGSGNSVSGIGYGYFGDGKYYMGCIGKGESVDSNALGFAGSGKFLNCTGTAVAGTDSYGFYVNDGVLSNCTAYAYSASSSATSVYAIYVESTAGNKAIITNCICPQLDKLRFYQQRVGIKVNGSTSGAQFIVSNNMVYGRAVGIQTHTGAGNYNTQNIDITTW